MPGVIIGHNADIAWGFTNLGPDVTDLYLERVDGDEWEQDGRQRPLTIVEETIRVRGEDDVPSRVRSTAHGPIISDVSDFYGDLAGSGSSTAVSLAWTALTPTRTADAIFDLDTATDWTSFREAVSSFAVPAQNIVYADRDGHIGYQAPAWSRSASPGTTASSRRRAGAARTTGPATTCRSKACPTCWTPTRASW